MVGTKQFARLVKGAKRRLEKRVPITIWIPGNTARLVDSLAAQQGMSRSEWLNAAVDRLLAEELHGETLHWKKELRSAIEASKTLPPE
jgi:metal-responsive CopG/Arc/MetJ family transcriptional regulator